MNNSDVGFLTYIFLLYVSVMLIITFLRQEFVLLPELQNLDIVGEDAKAQLLDRYQRMRWVSFLLVPVLLALMGSAGHKTVLL